MAIDYLSGEFTGEQVKISPDMIAPLVSELDSGDYGFIDYAAVWMDGNAMLWLDANALCTQDKELVGDDDYAVVIKTPIGYIIDVSYMQEDGTSADVADREPALIQLLPQSRPAYDALYLDFRPVPVVGLVTSSLERDMLSGILLDQFEIVYPEPVDQEAQ